MLFVVAVAVGAQVVDASHMVVVAMREQCGVDVGGSCVHNLLTEIRTAVDQQIAAVDRQQCRCPQSFVVNVGHVQPICGTPDDVPVPRKRSLIVDRI